MTVNERDVFTNKLADIYIAAHHEISALQEKRATDRTDSASESFSTYVAKTRALSREAFNKILAQLQELELTKLPTLAALYFHELSALKYEVTKLKATQKYLREELETKRIRLREEVEKRRAYRTQLVEARAKLRSAKAARQRGAAATHKEHRSMKAEVFAWLDLNRPKFKSMDKAAEAITKQQPIAFRTARDWVGEWKKLRSAGTP
jgi:hypothetical protein